MFSERKNVCKEPIRGSLHVQFPPAGAAVCTADCAPPKRRDTQLRVLLFGGACPDLNWGMKVLQTFALPLGHGTRFLYEKKECHERIPLLFGAGDEARTRYLHLGKVALYRMSYTRIMVPPVGVEPTTRGFSVRCSTY